MAIFSESSLNIDSDLGPVCPRNHLHSLARPPTWYTGRNSDRRYSIKSRDLRSFEIRFEFESDDSDSIRFESDGLIRNFRSRTCRRTMTNHKKKL